MAPEPDDSQRVRWVKTALLAVALFSIGASYSAINTALPDLVSLYGSSTASLSFTFVASALGRVCVAMALGNRWITLSRPLLAFAGALFLTALIICTYPFMPTWEALLPVTFVLGLSTGILFIGSNGQCLEIWRHTNSEPYMHGIHFLYSCGYFFSPLVAMQFLSSGSSDPGWELIPGLQGAKSYFLVLGLLLLVFVPGFLYAGHASEFRRNKDDGANENRVAADGNISVSLWIMIVLFNFIYFLEIAPWSIGTMMSTYATTSHLQLTLTQAAQMCSIFYGCYAVSRFFAIFTCRLLDATKSIYVYLGLIILAGAAILWRRDDMTLSEVSTYVGVIGLGMGPLYSTTMLVFEHHSPVTSQIVGLVYVADNIRDILLPWTVGQFMDEHPLVLFVASTGTSVVCTLIFVIVAILGPRIRHKL